MNGFGFGFLGDVSKLMPVTEGFEDSELVELDHRALTEAQEAAVDNVKVQTLNDQKYVPTTKDETEDESEVNTIEVQGSAGNPVEATDEEAQLGSVESLGGLGGGLNMSKEMARTESENGGMVVDEAPFKNARDTAEQNSIDKVKDFFDEFQVKKLNEMSYDLDTTELNTSISDEPIKRMPKGW
jgi:hypothetical protein